MKLSKLSTTILFSILIGFTGLSAKDITAYHKEVMGEVNFNKHGLAAIITKDGWVVINKKMKVLYVPYIYDNGPDYISEGLSRYVDKGKIGFVNIKGKVIIPAAYDFVSPFEDGKAQFCNGCKSIQEGEHSYMDPKSGVWGTINKKGKVVGEK
jgi:hypothetical protein